MPPVGAMSSAVEADAVGVEAGRLASYVAAKIPGARNVTVSGLARIPGGLSRETWAFDATWDADGAQVARELILRRDPDASLLVTSRDTEFGILRALLDTEVPVPEVLWLERESTWLDSPFFVMARVPGETSPAMLIADPRYDQARATIAQRKVELLAELHEVDWDARGVDFLPAPSLDGCAAAEIARWERVLDDHELEPQPMLRGAFEWMKRHPPPAARRISVVHGDYRTGNFLYTPGGEITAILDWELAHLGDPIEDLAYDATCRFTPDGMLGGVGLVGGLFERTDLFARYESASGHPVDPQAVHFWEVLANVKIASIALTGARAFCDGRTNDLQMAFLGTAAHVLSQTAIALIEAGP